MTFTFDDSLSADRDKVRFKIADTVESSALVSDETIAALLTSEGSVVKAAIACCRFILRRYARVPATSVGDVRIASLVDQYQTVLKELEREAAKSSGVSVYAGGISVDDKRTRETDTDRVPPFFGRRTHANPGGVTPLMVEDE